MKSLFLALILSLSLWAEATFDQVQSMIDKQEYKQAKLALTVIANNHPNSAKVYYTLAQANAGLGDLPSARDAFNKAVALNPKLDFAPSSAVDQLREALTPPTSKIVAVYTPTHTFFYMVLGAIGSVGIFFLYRRFKPLESPTVTPTATPSRKYDTASSTAKTYPSSYHESSIQGPPARGTYSTYSDPTPAPTVTEVHHHHHDSHKSSGMSTLGTVAVAAGTAAVVSSMMDNHSSFHHSSPIITPTYEESTRSSSISSSWEDTTSTSSSWEEPTTRPSSWDSSSSSSSSDSWSSSSDSSSSSWD